MSLAQEWKAKWKTACEELESERAKWLAQSERDRVRAENDRARLVARVETAEKERDEAKDKAERWHTAAINSRKGEIQADTRAEAAEADNAALLELLRAAVESDENDDAWAERVLAATAQPHPGAALLEGLRRLRELERLLRLDMKGDEPARLSIDTMSKLDALDQFRSVPHG